MKSEIAVFGGSAHRELAAAICKNLGAPLLPVEVRRFSNDCMQVQLQASCRERDTFFVQPLIHPVQDNLMELLQMLDAAKGSAASRLTAVIPYFAYARSDKKDEPRISITAKLVADLIKTAGADRVITFSLHSPQVHGFFSCPVDHLNALKLLAKHFNEHEPLNDTVVVSPDMGNGRNAARFARYLGLPVAVGNKRRLSDERVTIDIVGEITQKRAIIIDDEIATGGTIIETITKLQQLGVERFTVTCTHALFTKSSIERIIALGDVIERIVITDTVPVASYTDLPKVTAISIASLLAEAIRRTHVGESISELFE